MSAELWHTLGPAQALDRLGTDDDRGLAPEDARARLREQGANRLEGGEEIRAWPVLLRQFKSVVILVLVAALGVSAFTASWAEAIAIAAVLVVNTVLGFVSEWRALVSMAALRQLGQNAARVRRGGEAVEIDAAELVPGDILLLATGDGVPADARLLAVEGLRVNEAALTGESAPVTKGVRADEDRDTPLAERSAMVYRGTEVSDGSGEAVVVATGAQTEMGRVAELTQGASSSATPLQRRLDRLGRTMALVVLGAATFVALAGLWAGQPLRLLLETAVALGVAAIPEGLPIVATIGLARGMWLLARDNALINRLPAVETLGATTTIFSDKTGTLTENRMVVEELLLAGETRPVASAHEEGRTETSPGPAVRRSLRVAALCNNAEDDPEQPRGDPMELALLREADRRGLRRSELLAKMPAVRQVPFDRETMMMASYHRAKEGVLVAVKGAPEAVLEVCDRQLAESGESEEPLDEAGRERWRERVRELAGRGLRPLALADKRAKQKQAEPYERLVWLGVVGLLDPPRGDVRRSVEACQRAGVRVVMVTGDQPETAAAVAAELGLVDDGVTDAAVVSGRELEAASPEESAAARDGAGEEGEDGVVDVSVYARVTPEQKLRLVEQQQRRGETVAMTGDGVNDTPALKKADIGIAMGERGTDAAREVADMVLEDDTFATIANAIARGRVIFGNIRRSVLYMLITNGAEVLAVAVASLLGWTLPLRSLQILYLNVLTDVFPALALAVGPGSGDEMDRPPRESGSALLERRHWLAIAAWSVLIGAVVLASSRLALGPLMMSGHESLTVSFLSLAFAKLGFVFALRPRGVSLLDSDVVRNRWIWWSLLLCAALLLVAVYVPGLSDVLDTTAPSWRGWLLIGGAAGLPGVLGQLASRRGLS